MYLDKGVLKGTLIESPTGTKISEFFKKGDYVYTMGRNTGNPEETVIEDIIFGWCMGLVYMEYDNKYIQLPRGQYVNTDRGVMKAENVERGDSLLGISHTCRQAEYPVEKISLFDTAAPVRRFRLEDDTGFFAELVRVF